ncbi:all trans-polyprenyl-diphosphate synthase PDSS1-like isoform X1 [Macrobrachium nipponense]|uniref:all trans-polyprenyl-diphosphate synthase PDSS1-like isoform X1 n=2 Tax=Macrobrachium nipponense TaxID=159736 RepID=UPI0030C808EE
MASSMRARVSCLLDAVIAHSPKSNSLCKGTCSTGTGILNGGIRHRAVSHVASRQSPVSANTHNSLKKMCGPVYQQCSHLTTGRPDLALMHKTGTVEGIQVQTPSDSAGLDLEEMFSDIKRELKSQYDLDEISKYYFDGQGKAVRPLITVLMSRAINYHLHGEARLYESQLQIAKITEMIHTASLVHDDVIDDADTRRGKPSVNSLYGQRKAVMAGDYILSVASAMLARVRNEEVIVILSKVLADLVQGEFMQLGSKENENERFAHYLKKSFKKTASLFAYSCKSVAVLSGADEKLQEIAFQYGRNVGITLQLVDDLLDFVSSASVLGKPAAADLKHGISTAPVLFACEKFPELNPMIMRRFQEPGDVERALEFVHKSDGLEQTHFLARQHCQECVRIIKSLTPSVEQKALISITDKVLNRVK